MEPFIRCYDTGCDDQGPRYHLILDAGLVLALSADCDQPEGVRRWLNETDEAPFGTGVRFEDLPRQVRETAIWHHFVEDREVVCSRCNWRGRESQQAGPSTPPRIALASAGPGEPVPAGACRHCGGMTHLLPPTRKDRQTERLIEAGAA